ncbi:MAG: hypothetical protein AB8E74_07270 [Prochlorococcus sp.]
MLQFLYFTVIFSLFYWLVSLMIQRFWAIRKVNITVEAVKKETAIQQLEQAFASEDSTEES